ncbi:diguanylate cyclase [Shewanella atlantica]|uniref:diguanylate cyclase n=2 Tax=Shewanella atlantica TaxID=271099 RepID=A0A431WFA5_9GAMM|nr:diguanylate cyclase [Shewanella atlantica]
MRMLMKSNNPNILIVDDKLENLITLERLLEHFDVDLIRASSGKEALAHLLDNDFALVLLDVKMPDMDGYEVAELMRGNSRTKQIPIIFVTAESRGDALIFKGYEAGAVDYLLKPLNASIFRSKVGVFVDLFNQKHALKLKTLEFDQKLAELEELQQQLEETNEQLLMLSTTDGLTSLYNRRKFDDIYLEEWQRASRSQNPISLVMLDIDHFKLYNDTYGHHKGDDCLRTIASALQAMDIRHLDKIARIGGEEFAVILPDTDGDGAMLVAERARLAIENLNIPHETQFNKVTASFGVSSIIPKREITPKFLMKAVDEALYESKKRGRNGSTLKLLKHGEEESLAM